MLFSTKAWETITYGKYIDLINFSSEERNSFDGYSNWALPFFLLHSIPTPIRSKLCGTAGYLFFINEIIKKKRPKKN